MRGKQEEVMFPLREQLRTSQRVYSFGYSTCPLRAQQAAIKTVTEEHRINI